MVITLGILLVVFIISLSFFIYKKEKSKSFYVIKLLEEKILQKEEEYEKEERRYVNLKKKLETEQQYIDNLIKREELNYEELKKRQQEQVNEELKLYRENELRYINEFLLKEKIDAESAFESHKKDFEIAINKLQIELDEYKAKRDSINEAILREREIKEKTDFYKIKIKDDDIADIQILTNIMSSIKNKEILNKLIYETYIKRPLSELIKRLTNGNKVSGIYKITYTSGEAYIGKSVDIGKRFQEHCKSSLNIGTIAHSSFHSTLAEKGLQNFTWEILEKIEKDKLSEREAYWINFYETKKYGFNMRQEK